MSSYPRPQNSGALKVEAIGDREIVMTRAFDATRDLVFRALTEPALIRRWLGVMAGWKFEACEFEPRVGGVYRYLWNGPGGQRIGISGVVREIVQDERIVLTEKFDQAWYDGEALVTIRLVEQAGRTTLTESVLYASRTVRDAVLKTPMGHGVAAGFDAMADLLQTLA
jgi:uncharacterized protein YndB with AHSA1/START domain